MTWMSRTENAPNDAARHLHMASCCPQTAHTYLASTHVAMGVEMTIIGGVSVYLAGKPTANADGGATAVVLIPDVWGWAGGRTRAIADLLATQVEAAVCLRVHNQSSLLYDPAPLLRVIPTKSTAL